MNQFSKNGQKQYKKMKRIKKEENDMAILKAWTKTIKKKEKKGKENDI